MPGTKRSNPTTPLRMKQLPKAEYMVMRSLMKEYALVDTQEAFAIMIALASEVYDLPHGKQWISNVVHRYRTLEEKERWYAITSSSE